MLTTPVSSSTSAIDFNSPAMLQSSEELDSPLERLTNQSHPASNCPTGNCSKTDFSSGSGGTSKEVAEHKAQEEQNRRDFAQMKREEMKTKIVQATWDSAVRTVEKGANPTR